MKKIQVAKDLCIGCGACVAIDPEHFDFDDSGKSNVISNENIVDNQNIANAIESCPTSAISLIEGEDSSETELANDDECNCDNECQCEGHCNCHHEAA